MPISENIEIIAKRTLFAAVGHMWTRHSRCRWVSLSGQNGAMNVVTAESLWVFWTGLSAVLVATWLGLKFYSRLDEVIIIVQVVVLVLLFLSGLALRRWWWSGGT